MNRKARSVWSAPARRRFFPVNSLSRERVCDRKTQKAGAMLRALHTLRDFSYPFLTGWLNLLIARA
jgi:hypothetical protein